MILSFSDWSVKFVVLSMLRIVQFSSWKVFVVANLYRVMALCLFSRNKSLAISFFFPTLRFYRILSGKSDSVPVDVLVSSCYWKFFLVSDYFFVRRYHCKQRSRVYDKIFFSSVIFYCHCDMIFPVGYKFYFGYYVYQLFGIALLGLVAFGNSLEFLSFSESKFTGFCKMPFLFNSYEVLILGMSICG